MEKKTCNVCKKEYSAATVEGLAKIFGYKNTARKWLYYKCRACKRKYDQIHNKTRRPNEIKKYRDFIRAETKKVIKGDYSCSVIDCGKKAELHHFDYTDPLAVLPVCRKHHSAIHRLNGLLETP